MKRGFSRGPENLFVRRGRFGEGKPDTFEFLGFTHFCTRSRKWGSFVIGRKTIKKRMRAKLLAIKTELHRIMHDPIAKTGAWIKRMLQGHLNYFAVSGNHTLIRDRFAPAMTG
jgi:RNA-directed DNA polymerase